jgi:hypothetical protein
MHIFSHRFLWQVSAIYQVVLPPIIYCHDSEVLDRMTGFIDTLFTQFGTTGNTALSLIYTRTSILSLH